MPGGTNNHQKVWNEDLVQGLQARFQQAFQQKKQSQHQWRDGVAAIQAVRKDIKRTSTDKIYNLPNPGKANGLTKSVYETCQRIIRGQEPLYPPGYVALSQAEFEALEQRQVDPYLVNKCAKRSGAHAILMAFHHGNIEATVTRQQICDTVRHLNLCDEVMEANFQQGRVYGAWKAKDTLIKHGFLLEYKAGASYTDRGFRSNGMHTYSITERGKRAIQYLLDKWPDTRECPRAGYRWNNPNGGGGRGNGALVPRAAGSSHLIDPDEDDPSLPIKKTKHSTEDERQLRTWLHTASVGSQMSWKMGKERRKYLHRLCDRMMKDLPRLQLQHESTGDTRDRQLFVTVLAKPGGRFVTPSWNDSAVSDEPSLHSSLPAKRELFPSDSNGKKLGGSSNFVQVGMSARDAAAAAALSRFDTAPGAAPKCKRTTAEAKPAKKPTTNQDTIDLLDDFDSDDDLNKKPAAKRPRASTKNDHDFQPGEDVYVSSPDGKSRGPLKVLRAHTSGHVTIREVDGRETKVEIRFVHPIVSALDDEEEKSGFSSLESATILPLLQKKSTGNEIIDLCESSSSASVQQDRLTILIDSRERSRNTTPRELRTGLSTQLQSGSLNDVWPANIVASNVVEKQLSYGDFAFEVSSQNNTSRLSVVVERKLIGDLVQRSTKGDHWRQLQRMRDSCSHAIMLIENDTQLASRFDAYGSSGMQRNSSNHTIESDNDVFLFIGRAILSSRRIKFLQTRDQQGTFRSLGALALMALKSSKVNRNAPASPPLASTAQQRLKDRLTSGGIDWRVAQPIVKGIGSIAALEKLVASCKSEKARDMLVFPILANVPDQGDVGSMISWSAAVSQVIESTPEECASARNRLQHIKQIFGDALPSDPATLLRSVYEESSVNQAVEKALQYSSSASDALPKRMVSIELSASLSSCFPVGARDAFYESSVRAFPGVSLARMTTKCGRLTSNTLCIYTIEATKIVELIAKSLKRKGSIDFVLLAKDVAETLQKSCTYEGRSKSDQRVILVRGLPPALLAAAKSEQYRSETKVLAEMVLASLMLDHECVILQAIRKKEDEMHMILQQLALACFHYQFLTKETTST